MVNKYKSNKTRRHLEKIKKVIDVFDPKYITLGSPDIRKQCTKEMLEEFISGFSKKIFPTILSIEPFSLSYGSNFFQTLEEIFIFISNTKIINLNCTFDTRLFYENESMNIRNILLKNISKISSIQISVDNNTLLYDLNKKLYQLIIESKIENITLELINEKLTFIKDVKRTYEY